MQVIPVISMQPQGTSLRGFPKFCKGKSVNIFPVSKFVQLQLLYFESNNIVSYIYLIMYHLIKFCLYLLCT
jgi:hypothetical protein